MLDYIKSILWVIAIGIFLLASITSPFWFNNIGSHPKYKFNEQVIFNNFGTTGVVSRVNRYCFGASYYVNYADTFGTIHTIFMDEEQISSLPK